MGDDKTPTVTIGEASERLGKSTNTVRRMIRRGELVAARTRDETQYTADRRGRTIRGHWRIDVASLERVLRRQKSAEQNLEKVPPGD